MFPRYRGIVVASAHMRNQYLRQGVPARDVHTIPLFADPGACDDGPVTRDIDVLFLGRLTPLKGATVLVDALKMAVARRGPMRAVIAGVGPERDALARSAASTVGLSVDLPGWVDAAQRTALFARSRVLAIPSRWPEPFGLVGLEAAHAGVPSVAFAVGGIPEWLTHDVNGRLARAAGGAASLATELLAALDPVVWTRLSAGARDATCRFSSGVHISALERVLHAVRAA
jgi:glycosyltransferase involved in cell wall biosynthesis